MQDWKFTLDDFRGQLRQFRTMSEKMGGVRALLRMVPGLAQMPNEALDRFDESELDRFQAAIDSMTIEERSDPDLLLDGPRRSRVAKGAGVAVSTVETLLGRFSLMRQQMRKLRKLRKP